MRSVTSQINEYDDDDDGGGYGLVNEIHKCWLDCNRFDFNSSSGEDDGRADVNWQKLDCTDEWFDESRPMTGLLLLLVVVLSVREEEERW